MAPQSLRLSKSRFLAGLQCHKQLWWRVHEPDAPELVPDPALRNILDQGNEVGCKAREYVPGGIYEATFLADETYAVVDILERGPRGYGLVEVKATNKIGRASWREIE